MGGLTVLVNAGPWLEVPPKGYGGIETVLAALVTALRARGVRVLLATVGEPGVCVDGWRASFPEPQFPRLGAPYGEVVGIAHAHLQAVLELLREHPETDLIHDHQEVVGPSLLAGFGTRIPPVLQTLHWDLTKHARFYATFDGGGRVFFNGVTESQLAHADPNLLAQTLGAVPLPVAMDEYAVGTHKHGAFLALGRITPYKGQDVAARVCKELGQPLVIAGPVAGVPNPVDLSVLLADPASTLHASADVRFYLESVQPFEDYERIAWIGSVSGARKLNLLRRSRALLMPIRWNEPGATVAIEALACGTPVVGYRRGALAEMIDHGVNGFLADDEREFADLLLQVDDLDPQACRQSVESRFSADAVAGRYLDLYDEVLRRTAAPPG